jgi:hypothetical protein
MNRDFASGEYQYWSPDEWRQWHNRRLAERVIASSGPGRLEEVRAAGLHAGPTPHTREQASGHYLGITLGGSRPAIPDAQQIGNVLTIDLTGAYDRAPRYPLLPPTSPDHQEDTNMEDDDDYQLAIDHDINWPLPDRDWDSQRWRDWRPPHSSSVPPEEEPDEDRVLYERARAREASGYSPPEDWIPGRMGGYPGPWGPLGGNSITAVPGVLALDLQIRWPPEDADFTSPEWRHWTIDPLTIPTYQLPIYDQARRQ